MKIDLKSLEEFIKSQDWTDFGIVSISMVKQALSEHEVLFDKWVESGYMANMDYLVNMKEDRYHPKNKLPDVKSVIVLTAWYGRGGKNNDAVIARYAMGKDYHKILKKKLLKLSEWMRGKDKNVETYLSVDSGPTVDRILAQVAGLGFPGKNSNLIDPRKGSYFFIASLMVNKVLPETERIRMPNCGDCKRCAVACPTDAIVSPGIIDARKCISYLTIENKEGIPVEFRQKIGNRLFGCDICQEVCPFNEGRAGRQEILIDELRNYNGAGDDLSLQEILSIETDEAYLNRFAGTPLMRAKRRGLLRNACVVAGNSDNKAIIPFLKNLIDRESDDMLIEHAKWAIEQLN